MESPALPQPLRRDRQRAPTAAAAAPEQKQQQSEQEGAQDGRQPPSVRPRELGEGDGKKGAGAEAALKAFSYSRGGRPRADATLAKAGVRGARGICCGIETTRPISVWPPQEGRGTFPFWVGCKILKEGGPQTPPHTHTHALFHTHICYFMYRLHTPMFPYATPPSSLLGHPYADTHTHTHYTLTLPHLHTFIYTYTHARVPSHSAITHLITRALEGAGEVVFCPFKEGSSWRSCRASHGFWGLPRHRI